MKTYNLSNNNKFNLTNVELMFAIKLEILNNNEMSLDNFCKIGYLTGYSSAIARKHFISLINKNIIEATIGMGRTAKTTFSFLVSPITLL